MRFYFSLGPPHLPQRGPGLIRLRDQLRGPGLQLGVLGSPSCYLLIPLCEPARRFPFSELGEHLRRLSYLHFSIRLLVLRLQVGDPFSLRCYCLLLLR